MILYDRYKVKGQEIRGLGRKDVLCAIKTHCLLLTGEIDKGTIKEESRNRMIREVRLEQLVGIPQGPAPLPGNLRCGEERGCGCAPGHHFKEALKGSSNRCACCKEG